MKILFWILAVLSILVGWFVGWICSLSMGIGLTYTVVGDVACLCGTVSLLVSIVCVVLGILKLRKGKVKKAVIFVVAGLVYSGVAFGGAMLDDLIHTVQLEKSFIEYDKQKYGEDWDSEPAIAGIPKHYKTLLNKYYVAVRDKWTADALWELCAVGMHEYFGDAPLDNIGFAMTDVNGDGVDELVIGTVAPVDGGTVIFCIYSDPENPFDSVSSLEGEIYYLHSGEQHKIAEIVGENGAWILKIEPGEAMVGIEYYEGTLDPAGRLTLEMTPFSRYK